MMPLYRVCIENKCEQFWTHGEAKRHRLQLQYQGKFPDPVEIYCSEHGWQTIQWGQCNQCRATQEMAAELIELTEET